MTQTRADTDATESAAAAEAAQRTETQIVGETAQKAIISVPTKPDHAARRANTAGERRNPISARRPTPSSATAAANRTTATRAVRLASTTLYRSRHSTE